MEPSQIALLAGLAAVGYLIYREWVGGTVAQINAMGGVMAYRNSLMGSTKSLTSQREIALKADIVDYDRPASDYNYWRNLAARMPGFSKAVDWNDHDNDLTQWKSTYLSYLAGLSK